jgi:hypothetical protein
LQPLMQMTSNTSNSNKRRMALPSVDSQQGSIVYSEIELERKCSGGNDSREQFSQTRTNQ